MQIVNIRNERGNINTDSLALKGIMREYYEQFYANKFGQLEEMG